MDPEIKPRRPRKTPDMRRSSKTDYEPSFSFADLDADRSTDPVEEEGEDE